MANNSRAPAATRRATALILACLSAGCGDASLTTSPAAPAAAARRESATAPSGSADAVAPAAAAVAATASAAPMRHEGHVVLGDDVRFASATPADRDAIADTLVQLLEAWCAIDGAAYGGWLAPEVTRVSAVTGVVRGVDAVVASLPREWEAMERPQGEIAVRLRIADGDVTVAGDVATALTTVMVKGQKSVRWRFEDRWRVFQVLRRVPGGGFRLVHQATATDLDAPGDRPGFDFELGLPVVNLKRAVAFYTPLLGGPERVEAGRAQFVSGASHVVLETAGLGGMGRVRSGLPSGWATIDVDALDAITAGFGGAAAGGRVRPLATGNGDRAAIVLDPSGNPLVLRERHPDGAAAAPPASPLPRGLPPAIGEALRAWLRADGAAFAATQSADAIWFDNTRSDEDAVARGPAAIRERLVRAWQAYDRGPSGLAVWLRVEGLRLAPLAAGELATYRLVVESTGSHAFRDETLVTQLLADGRIAATFAVRALPDVRVRELDYVAYPAARLGVSERFYRERLGLGRPYTDEDWFGFWGAHAVFGIFAADRERDGIPVAEQSNAYPSFWVASARATYDDLVARGAGFPLLPAINTRRGIDPQPGYTQVVATDPDGNVLVFTEYTGH